MDIEMKLFAIVLILTIIFSGCIVQQENEFEYAHSDDLFNDTLPAPECNMVTRQSTECGVVNLEVDYNEYVCAVRNYRYDSGNIVFNHYDGNYGTCNSSFTVTIHNKEYFDGDFNVQLELSDHDLNHFTTISKKVSIDANATREVYQKYNYSCGQPHIVNVIKKVIPPKRKFCEWKTKTRIDPTYLCRDVNVSEEICE